MTEACSSITFMTLYDPKKENHSQQISDLKTSSGQEGICVGKPAPHVELRVGDEESSSAGKILMRGPHVMLRYWNHSPPKHLGPVHEGWLDTGDMGRMDDCGNLWLIGREKDRIKSGGENVYPGEVRFNIMPHFHEFKKEMDLIFTHNNICCLLIQVETVLSQHPGISSIVVVGVPDSRLTEMVVACIRLKKGWQWAEFGLNHSTEDGVQSLSSEILRQFCKGKNLTGYLQLLSF